MSTNVVGSRQDQYSVSVTIGTVATGVWDTLTGGEMGSEETKYKPGGMAKEIALGGTQTVGNVTVERIYDITRDHANVKTWMNGVGKLTVVITKQPLDVDGNVVGSPLTYTGKLMTVTPPEHDSESSDVGKVSIEVSVATVA